MNKVIAAFAAVSKILATYPAMSSALVNIGVIVAAYFGLPLTGPELLYLVGVVTTLFGVIVHSNVVPLAKLSVTPAAPVTAPAPPDAGITISTVKSETVV